MVLVHLTDQKPDNEVVKVVKAAIEDANILWQPSKYEGEYPISGFGITELRPKHVYSTAGTMRGSAYWSMSCAAASTFYDWINLTTTDMAYIIPTGLLNLSPNPQVVEIKFDPNGQELPVLNIEQMYALDLARVWIPKPFFVKPSGSLIVRAVARQAVTDERIGLLGYTLAKRAYLILQ